MNHYHMRSKRSFLDGAREWKMRCLQQLMLHKGVASKKRFLLLQKGHAAFYVINIDRYA